MVVVPLISPIESTCFNDVYDSVHETDVDCGGIYCEPCNITQVSHFGRFYSTSTYVGMCINYICIKCYI